MRRDCSRPEGSEWDIGQNSEWGTSQKSDMLKMQWNIDALRVTFAHSCHSSTTPVIYQINASSPMEPRTLLMAYEGHGNVRPVVSDFDCLLFGTRGMHYKDPIETNQLEIM